MPCGSLRTLRHARGLDGSDAVEEQGGAQSSIRSSFAAAGRSGRSTSTPRGGGLLYAGWSTACRPCRCATPHPCPAASCPLQPVHCNLSTDPTLILITGQPMAVITALSLAARPARVHRATRSRAGGGGRRRRRRRRRRGGRRRLRRRTRGAGWWSRTSTRTGRSGRWPGTAQATSRPRPAPAEPTPSPTAASATPRSWCPEPRAHCRQLLGGRTHHLIALQWLAVR